MAGWYGDDGFYDRNGKWWISVREFEEDERKKLEIRARVNGFTPAPDRRCDCGAKFDREFPQVHSDWCFCYQGNK